MSPRSTPDPTLALFVRLPAAQARKLDRAARALGSAKKDLVTGLVDRYVDPDSDDGLDALRALGASPRRVIVEADEPPLVVGHHAFRPADLPEVLTPSRPPRCSRSRRMTCSLSPRRAGCPGGGSASSGASRAPRSWPGWPSPSTRPAEPLAAGPPGRPPTAPGGAYDAAVAAAFRIMGILNVTPDSFSDGGEWFERGAAVEHGHRLAAEGAAILDVGGESTRPYAQPVAAEDELARVIPVIEALVGAGAQLSVDTMKVAVARAAVEAGATLVNDVTAFRHEPGMAALVAERGCDCCLMHMLGDPQTMQEDPRYDDVVSEVKAFLEERAAFAVAEGVPEARILVDPGIGFGKTVEHNLELVRRLDEIVALGFPVVVGTSRKAFLGRLTGREDPHDRVAATVATNVLALERGASVFRVHDVAESVDALTMAAATLAPHGA